jgi:hypothetical protein
MSVNDWISTDEMLPAFEKPVLLAYAASQDNGRGVKKLVYTYSMGELRRDGSWYSQEGALEETGQFAAMATPQWWMPIVTPPPF